MYGLLERNKMLVEENNELKLRFEAFTQKLQSLLEEFGQIGSSYQLADFEPETKLEEISYADSNMMYTYEDSLLQTQTGTSADYSSTANNSAEFVPYAEETEDDSQNRNPLDIEPADLEYDPGKSFYRQKLRQNSKESIQEKESRFPEISITPISTQEALIQCRLCSFSCQNHESLQQHIHKKHRNKLFCEKCEYVGNSTQALKYHMTSVHAGVRYQCDQCDYVCFQQLTLKRHKEAHHSAQGLEKFLSCNLCAYVASDAVGLKRHKMRVHMNGKYRCKVCKISFNCKKTCRTHVTSAHHKRKTKRTSYHAISPCDQCVYIGNSKQALDYHMQSKHSGFEHPCNICEYVGNTKINLKNHMFKRHGIDGLPKDLEPRRQGNPTQSEDDGKLNGETVKQSDSRVEGSPDGIGVISEVFIKLESGGEPEWTSVKTYQ